MREIKPDCRKCAHFQRFYIKENAAFVPILNGVCQKRTLNANERKRLPWSEDCGDMMPAEGRKELQREEARKVLQQISERLNEIALYLRDEE